MTNHRLDAFIAVVWVVFWLYWLISAFTSKHNQTTRWRSFIWFRLLIVVLVVILVHSSNTNETFWRNSFDSYKTHELGLQIAGTVILLSGLAFAIWARLNLGRNWGMPMSEKKQPELVTSGPYRFVRHPIYSGLIAAMIGTAMAVNWYWLIIMVLAGGYFIFSATKEEEFMLRQFPKDYPAYKRSSKMLIPFIF